MNRLTGKITAIAGNAQISQVEVMAHQDVFSAILLESPETADYLRIGQEVTLLFKETEVALAKDLGGLISLSNRISANIKHIERGDILSAVTLDYAGQSLVSVITTRSVERLGLAIGSAVIALIKANEIALMAGHHDS